MSLTENRPLNPDSRFYHTNGTMGYDTPSYVERDADRELYDSLQRGEFSYVLTSRQMGKSSLMVRTAVRLRQQGVAVAVLDLTALGQNLTPEQWYEGLLGSIGTHLDLEDELEEFWLDHERLAPLQRWMRALREVVLSRCVGRVVIFIDETDAVRSLPFSTDEFFAAIRECYNRRTEDPELGRLTFCLLGVATPSDLIQDTRTTPFNIGRRIELHDFTEAEAAPLSRGIADCGLRIADCHALLRRILYWTGGHPYLTQRLCQAVAEAGAANPQSTIRNPQSVDRLCEELFLSHRAQERDDNLLLVRERLLRNEADPAALLDLYGQVRSGKHVRDEETSPLVDILRLSGVVRVRKGELAVRNRIYARVFDRGWVAAHMPDAELRRQRVAYRRGLLRAASVSGLIVCLMVGLALTAMSQKHRAEAASAKLNVSLEEAEKLLAERNQAFQELGEQKKALEEALGVAKAERLLAKAAATQAKRAQLAEKSQRNQAVAARERAEDERLRAEQKEQLARAKQDEAERERLRAEKQRRIAVAQKSEAIKQREESQQRLVRLNVANGWRLVDEGDPLGSLPWFAQALWLDRERPDRLQVHRMRMAALLRQSPRLLHVWFHAKPAHHAEFSADGRRVVTASGDGTAQVLDAETGKRVIAPLKHRDTVWYAAFSPDSRRILTASEDGTAQVWDAATGKPVAPAFKHDKGVFHAAFSSDGSRVATAGSDNTARVWDAATGQPVTPSLRYDHKVVHVSFSPDGRRLAAAGFDGKSRVWDAATGEPVTPWLTHRNTVRCAVFSPDGRRIVTASCDHTAQVWDAETGERVTPLLQHSNWVQDAAFSPDSRRVVTVSWDQTARVWNAATGEPVTPPLELNDLGVQAAFSPDGRWVVTASSDRTARVWDASTGESITPPLKHSREVTDAAFSPDGRRVVTSSWDGTVRVWDVATGTASMPAAAHSRGVRYAEFSPDGRRIVTASEDGTARVWDTTTENPITPPLKHGGAVWSAAFSPDGRCVVTASQDKTARIWDAATGGALTPPLTHTHPLWSAAFSPDGRRVVTASDDKTARVWNASTGKPTGPPLGHSKEVVHAAFSPDGRRVVTASRDNTARVWDAATGRPITPPLRHTFEARYAEFSPDSRRVVTASWDGTARVWDAATGRAVSPELRHNQRVQHASFSLDGRRVVTASHDQTARVWDATTGNPITPPMKHPVRLQRANFSPDGRRVITAGVGSAGAARVWDALTGEPITPILAHRDTVWHASFSPDGHRVVTASGDGSARIWGLPQDDRSLRDIPRLAHVLSGHRIDSTAGFVPIDPQSARQAWDVLRAKYPAGFTTSRRQVLEWHSGQAERAEKARDWSAAIAHLDRLIEEKPVQAALRTRRATAYAESGRWEHAASDWARVAELEAEDAGLWHSQALARLAMGDTAGYRRACGVLLERFGTAEANYAQGLLVASACMMAPNAVADPGQAVEFAEKLAGRLGRHSNIDHAVGALLYRAGRFDASVQQIDKAVAACPQPATGVDLLFLALAHHRLGHTAEARQRLQRAVQQAEENSRQRASNPAMRPVPWTDRLELKLLRREAEALIQPGKP